ncbi:MAG: TatD family hydrolase [Alphaproteobacteria bacterium]|nr:TatD family hydrolase [Alphaproteobacteria bacterium]OJV46788.1 MAG: LuxR family transcriptional regulator [Alphaproteobacteria bacterium 43-37]
MKLVDSHCHLSFPDFLEDQQKVIGRAREAGVMAFLNICTKLDEIEMVHSLTTEPGVYCSVGIHPHEASMTLQTTNKLKHILEERLQTPKTIGLGETGLDYYYNHSEKDDQEQSFRIHCELAVKYHVPLIIHTRDADEDAIRILDDYPGVQGVFHCFSGSEMLAEQAISRGFYLSLSGILTFKKADELRKITEVVPLDKLLVETDAPYLAPIPHRGHRNEPAYVIETAKMLAQIKGKSLEEIATATTANFFKLFSRAETFQ